ncbi:MAG: helix-turn-helix domain-containing protein, partial [Planctomycetes bacterium]|nr:helix-turn-helix domain-containing protein [Planctomycetota bacterium]
HRCPAGYTELAVPVISGGIFSGILFAGQCWTHESPPPHPDLIVPPSLGWLEDRLTMLKAVANELGDLLLGRAYNAPRDRRTSILRFIDESMERHVTIEELAEHLKLSPSRAGHLIKETFNMTFPKLLNEVKLREAAHLLSSTDMPVGEVASIVGYNDQNYFSRIFSERYKMCPRDYRKAYPSQA